MKDSAQDDDSAIQDTPAIMAVGLRHCCPRCGRGKLYKGILKPAEGCTQCKLDYDFIDAGDGPAVFVILIIGFVVTAMAMAVQSAFEVPIWLHLVLWVPLILILSVWGLQFSKSIMIALQYQTKAEQGELDHPEK